MIIPIDNNRRYLNNSREYIEYFNDEIMNSVPYTESVEDGYILPLKLLEPCKGGVVDRNRNVVQLSLIENDGSYIRIDGSYEFDEYDESYKSEKVIYLGYFFKHWGHFLTDSLDRFWVLLDDVYADYRVVFPPHPGSILSGNYWRFLELLGITKDRIIDIDKPTKFNEIVIPSPTRIQDGRRHSRYFESIFRKVVENAKYDASSLPDKIFFSRGKLGKYEFGEEEIKCNFEMNGYTTLYPEKLSLDEQIGLFQNASEIVSQNSSICLNVVFANPNLKWVVINKYSQLHSNFSELRYNFNMNVTFIDAYSDKLNFYGHKIGTVPYLMSFNANLARFFCDKQMMYKKFGIWYRTKNIIFYLTSVILFKPRSFCKFKIEKVTKTLIKMMPRTYQAYRRLVER